MSPADSNSPAPQTKADAIASLNQTIDKLENILSQLDADPSDKLPSPDAFANLVSSIDALAASLEASETVGVAPETPEPEIAEPAQTPPVTPEKGEIEVPELSPAAEEETTPELSPPASQPTLIDRVLPNFSTLQRVWDSLLNGIRGVLPASLSEKLSDWGLTAIIAATIVAVLWTGVLLLPEETPEVAQAPEAPTPAVKTETPAATLEAPEEISAPAQPKAVNNVPPPKPKLTPEQGLIAAIQNQVSEITNEYAEGLIESIEANFIGSRLLVTVSPEWYTLSPSRQDKVANEMYARSRRLDFSKLELNDPDGTLLARSPVVGNQMVILQR
jgi:hypothetical protein